MPWYYAGPEAKPVGPLSLEELQARHAQGIVKPETYVIEHTGAPGPDWSWKRYQELFPPTQPPVASLVQPPAPPVATPPLVTARHPLFPSAAAVPAQTSVFPSTPRPDPYYAVKPTSGWCAWGFGLGLAGFCFSFACGLGMLLAFPSLLLCLFGLARLRNHPEQSGRGLALWGLALSTVTLLVSIAFIVWVAVPMIKTSQMTVTEQTSNDSE